MSQNETTSATPPKHVKCPTCGGDSLYSPANRFRPFCSERCKMIDLGAWGNEDFRVPAEAPPEDNIYGDPKLEP
ncbi:DNA gyrase inhibitor YacG [Diaphorobacter sp. HDW4B]|uniref:DNA gyrase inhibitor YacG n=1 Tax=Diaphorobacter sp. HDW4B TaxID=2714925 RepID=UPI00140881D4|nr:DNA gyrase inhibitor YacG [Diaphorobacter sp. HDW4B]QIL69883.1 DNA gyrase inhibitor YacG [Diaphorobacter sp. HDW4B]